MKELTKTFCILPWIHVATYNDGSALLCCVARNSGNLNLNNMTVDEVWNSDHFKQARVSMLKGEQVPACHSCYKEEEAGILSHRQAENISWSKELGIDMINQLVDETKEDGSVNHNFITLDMRLGNTCNLQCLMCRPNDSSKWLKDATTLAKELVSDAKWDWKHKIEIKTSDFDWYKNEKFKTTFYEAAGSIRHIIFAGGEPLYIKEHKEIIQELVARGFSKNIELRYHTNGTILSQDIINLWEQFKMVKIMISLDGAEPVNSIIRSPANWKEIEKNLRIYDSLGDNFVIELLCTVQALNIYYLPEFSEWILAQNYKKIRKAPSVGLFHCGTLHWPRYMSTKILPKELKKEITEKIESYVNQQKNPKFFKKLLDQVNFMNSEDCQDKISEFTEYIDKISTMKGLQIREKLPEIFKYF